MKGFQSTKFKFLLTPADLSETFFSLPSRSDGLLLSK